MTAKFQCLFLAALSLLVGCTIFRNHDTPLWDRDFQIPEQWNAGNPQQTMDPPAGWLGDFNDENLRILVTEAIDNNRDLAAVSARMDAALSQARIAGADLLPELSGGANASRNQRTSSTGFQLTTSRATVHSLNLNTNWELDLWGRLRNRKHAALADFHAAEATFQAARLSLIIQVAKGWFNAVEAKLQVQLVEQKIQSFIRSLEVIQQGFNRGINSSLDIRLARANLANTESTKAAQQRVLDTAVRTLEVLLGRYPDSQLQLIEELPTIVRTIPVGLPSELLSRRPDLIAAEKVLKAAVERRKGESKNFLPSIALTGSGGTTGPQLKNLLNFNFLVWSIAADLTQPLFQGGRLKAQRALAQANEREAVTQYAHNVLLAFKEVESALAAEVHLVEQESALKRAKEESLQAESIALERYQKGLEGIITLLDTQRRTLDAQRSFIEVRNQGLQNRLDLYLALGGDFEMDNEKKEMEDN